MKTTSNIIVHSGLVISIAAAVVIFNDISGIFYIMHGSYGAALGIIAGSIGIIASKSKDLSRVNCFWISHIVMVSDI